MCTFQLFKLARFYFKLRVPAYLCVLFLLARQFREAKKIAEEEKSISVSMAELKSEVDGMEESLAKMNESLSLLNKELIATRQEREEARV